MTMMLRIGTYPERESRVPRPFQGGVSAVGSAPRFRSKTSGCSWFGPAAVPTPDAVPRRRVSGVQSAFRVMESRNKGHTTSPLRRRGDWPGLAAFSRCLVSPPARTSLEY